VHTMYLLCVPCPLRKRCFFVHCTQYLEAARPADAAALQAVAHSRGGQPRGTTIADQKLCIAAP
jgi:hypothetical protein